jgi:DNA-binding FadR family transcriptional regulator
MAELLNEIKRVPISKEIMSQLRELILNGKIKTGEKIPSERELTERFNVSRNMVREAIRGLEMLGFLEIHQGAQGGAFVRDFTHDRLSNIFLDFYLADRLSVPDLVQARLLVEPEVARLAAKNITREGSLLLLEALKNECFKEDMRDRIENLVAVHCALAKLCGNTFYDIMVNALIAISQEIIVNTFEKGRDEPIHGYGRHDEIVKAVLDGDSKKAAESMSEHLQVFAKAFGNFDKIRKGKPPLIQSPEQ